MPPKEALALRIPADEMAFLRALAEQRRVTPQDYLKRLIHRNFKAHLRRQERQQAAQAYIASIVEGEQADA